MFPIFTMTDNQFTIRKTHTKHTDRFSLKMSHFAALILRVDIQTNALYFQEFTKIPGRETTYWGIQTAS